MNNKLFARIMTAVICICMMSTVVFAADTAVPELNADNTAIVFSGEEGYTSAEDQITIMAFAVEKGTAAADVVADGTGIVAINQVGGTVGFKTVPINPAIFAEDGVAEGKDIAVMVGGSNGDVKTFVISEQSVAPTPTTYTVTYELNGGTVDPANATTFTSETVDAFLEALADPTKADLVVDTETETTTTVYTFAGWYLDAEFTTAATAENVALVTTTAITLYAKYDEATTSVPKQPAEPETVTVTLNGNGGLFGEAATLAVEIAANATFADVLASATYVEPVKTKTNAKGDKLDWAFVGWYTNEACETAVDLAATVSATNLYAKFVKVYIVGDANEDGVVNATDYAQIKLYYRSTATPKVNTNFPAIGNLIPDNAYTVKKTDKSEVVYKVGDINGDGNVNATDYAQVKLYYRSTSSPKENANFVTIGKAVTIKKD